jgi:hypothetical protein
MSQEPLLPPPRGALSDALIGALTEDASRLDAETATAIAGASVDPIADDDLQLALYVAYELVYRGFDGVDDALEWDPGVVAFRVALERRFESALRERVVAPAVAPADVPAALRALARDDGGTMSRFLERKADLETFREFVMHRSAYHLKEADPHSFAIPRITGEPKVALVEIQADEYGGGDAAWMHAALFARTMRGLGLDDTYGAYLARLPGTTLATVNAMSLFGLHRRLRGAAVGHLAMFELTSTLPNRRYGNGLRRLGADDDTTRFFDEHVEADAVHEAIAANDLVGRLVAIEPELAPDVLFGAHVLLALDGLVAERTLGAWEAGGSSLLPAPPDGARTERGDRVA